MKALKLIMTLFLFVGLASCGNDDDGGSVGVDRIVGKWEMQSLTINGVEWEITDCEAQSTIEFFANGNVTSKDFFDDGEECNSESYTEKWENRGNNVYRFTSEGESTNITIIFSNNNNTFTVSETDEDGTYTVRYVRI